MKKVLLFIISVVSVLHSYAQNVDSVQVHSTATTIDSLSLRLNKLQRDYDFLYCDYELNKLMLDLKDLSSSLDIMSNRILIDYYNNIAYYQALYTAYRDNYDAKCVLFNSLKDKIETVKLAVLVKMAASVFSEQEQDVIYSCFSVIQKSVKNVELSLDCYNVALRAYQSKRRY